MTVDSNILTATLTCLGARTDEPTRRAIQTLQNPFSQKRGGLGYGAYASVQLPDGVSQFVNINVFASEQASRSPLSLQLDAPEATTFALCWDGLQKVASGSLLRVPHWGLTRLSTGRVALEVLQQHGPSNLVGVLGSTACQLFASGRGCNFCMLRGGDSNSRRTVAELIEAFKLARQSRSNANLTVTTPFLDGGDSEWLLPAVRELRDGLGAAPLALEINPIENHSELLRALHIAGLTTLMVPLDCSTLAAQQSYMPGKAALLAGTYWEMTSQAVAIFGAGNVTSSLIIGLEPLQDSLAAIRKMIRLGIVPEPVPVRWDDSLYKPELPCTASSALVAARQVVRDEMQKFRATFARTQAGCAACGGCAGIVPTKLPVK